METIQATRQAMEALKNIPTSLPGVFVLEPRVFGDERGFFFESYNQKLMASVGISEIFVQDNHSSSSRNVLRGLHYQIKHPQGKLVRAIEGEILDVAVDMRRSSPTFGRSEGVRLSADNKRMLWIPVGFAHGFCVLSEKAQVLYKATDFYAPEHERTLSWNDAQLKIDWQLDGEPIVSAKDQRGVAFRDAECFD
ncbi:MAG TPA: dTDP-4-dehydrorhamnose 3,5-epimerase [Candidatus Aquilonibacter sp.]|jgi:dTDP-4-dehydrorhamnose 3,5-epimerase|nr:dTDP-4-dehydrorhamnose 3,5-epimerase [Candidatus Aquilonibacter sp.]